MEAVEALYKTHPEYFIYHHLQSALNQNNPKLLYKGFPKARESKAFDTFTVKSLSEIRRNLLTPKYPVLFSSHLLFNRLSTDSFSKKEIKQYCKIIDILAETTLSEKEDKIISELTRSTQLWMNVQQIQDVIDQKYIKIPIN